MPEAESKQEERYSIDYTLPKKSWMEPSVEFRKGTYCYSAVPKHQQYLDLPNPREWQPYEDDWKLPKNWKEIILEGMRDRWRRFRSFRLFLDISV